MQYLEVPLIMAIAAITDCIIFSILYYRFIKRPFGHIIGMAKAYAGTLGQKSGESKRATINSKLAREAKEKMAKGLVEGLPFGAQLGKIMESQGISGEELFALAQDPNFINGLTKILEAGSSILGKLAKPLKKDDEKPRLDTFSLPVS